MLLVAGAVRAETPRVTAAAGTPVIDGDLSDAAWANAQEIALVQQDPHPGEPTAFRTTVRTLIDEHGLSIAFECFDPQPQGIAIHTMQRDGEMDGDDSVAIVLDTFGDERTAYFFRVNAAGARADGLVADRNLSLDWDGVWEARVRRTAGGWSAEIAIPATTLRFASRDTWGFNAERYVARERQTLRWWGISLDASFRDLRRAGRLDGAGALRQGLGLSLTSNAVVRHDSDFENDRRSLTAKPGLDASYNVTPQLGAVLTLNTDFAETEVDTRQVNLTRFPLFFPEKRAFFLEGSNLFRFGGTNLTSDFVPFYSRRVGLFRGMTVPLHAGLKVLGRSGKWSGAALDVQMGETRDVRAANLFAGRVTYDVNGHLRIGAIATNGSPGGTSTNRLGGIDALWSTSTFRGDKNLAASAWIAASSSGRVSGRRTGWGIEANYPNDRLEMNVAIHEFGDGLDPALGFLPRPGTRKYLFNTAYQPRTSGGWIRQFFYELFLRRYDDLHGDPESWRVFTAPFNVESQSGVHLEANWVRYFERIDAPFEIAGGVAVAPGRYTYDRFRVEGQSSPNRPIGYGSTLWFGGFYGGRLTETEAFVSWNERTGRLRFELEAIHDAGRIESRSFAQRLLQFKAILALTPNLIVSSYTQYDSESREAGLNNRVRWTIHPNADLFVVWNRGWKHPLGDDERSLLPMSNQFVVKLRWITRR